MAYYATNVITSILSANTTELNSLLYGFEDELLHPDKATHYQIGMIWNSDYSQQWTSNWI